MTTTKKNIIDAVRASADCAEIIHLQVCDLDGVLSIVNLHSDDCDYAEIRDGVVDVEVWGTIDGREFRLALTGGAR